MCVGTSKCGSDMQFISIFHLMALLHTPPAAMKDLWLEWLDGMVASVLFEKAPMQLAFDPYLHVYFWSAVDIRGVMWWYNPLMRAIILLTVDETFWMCLCMLVTSLGLYVHVSFHQVSSNDVHLWSCNML